MQTVRRTSNAYDVDALRTDANRAVRMLDFGAGVFAHSMSLPGAEQIAVGHREHRNNLPYADALKRCPYIKDIFDGFRTEKAGLRLLWRNAGTAYSLHDDRDLGTDVIRLQLPVIANPCSFLLMQKPGIALEPLARRVATFADGGDSAIRFDFRRLMEVFGDWLDVLPLDCGYFHLIKADQLHSLVNGGTTERMTLCLDLVRNQWLDNWMAVHLDSEVRPVGGEQLPAGEWDWSALRHGLLTHPRIELSS